VIAGVCALVGSGTSTFRVVASAIAIVLAIVGIVLKNRWLPVIASAMVVVLAVTHFEVFEHQLLAGWAPELLQRFAISAALALGAAVVGSELVAGLGASSAVESDSVGPTSGEPATVEP
jgi:hypothetical protein